MTVHVVGAGLAGLSAAVELAARDVQIVLHEAAAQAGGRCRSYYDAVLEMTVDNGNHLVLSGNQATFAYLDRIGSTGGMVGPAEPRLDFHDLRDGARWTLRPNPGPLAWWLAAPSRRTPGATTAEHLALVKLLAPPHEARIDAVLPCRGVLWDRLLEPFLLAALNTEPRGASAHLASGVVRESLALGGRAYRPRIAHPNLSAVFVDPALAFVANRGGQTRLGAPLKAIAFDGDRATALHFAEEIIPLARSDYLILAVPPWIAQDLAPGIKAPDAFSPIVNAHYKITPPSGLPAMIGVIGGRAQWIFAFEDRLSVTVSAADDLVDLDRESLSGLFWKDIARVHGLAPEAPPCRIIKERRATFLATPAQDAKRPGAASPWRNLALAGDWTATGLPSTIEGAIRSGKTAAERVS
jgi:squalene-associated FAD-dependent desaturase